AALSYLLAGLICLPVAMIVSELATGMPQAGGSYHLISRALGPAAGAVVGPSNWLGLTFATGFYLLGFAQYVAYFIAIPPWATVLIAGAFFVFLNYRGAKLSGRVQAVIVVVLLLILARFVGRGLFNVEAARHRPFLPFGWGAVVATVGLIIVSFTGFEKISTIAGEIKQPERNLPLAIVGSVLIATLLYAAILFVATGIITYQEIDTFQAPLVEVANRFMSAVGVVGMSLAALLATASSANAAIMASSRINFAMGRDRVLPAWFYEIHSRYLTPHRSILVTGGLAVMLGLSGQAAVLAEISSALFMISYALLSLGLIVMRRAQPSWYRPAYRAPLYPWLPVLSSVAVLAIIATMEPASQIAGLVLAVLSLGWYLVWGRHRTPVEGELLPWLDRAKPYETVISAVEQVVEAERHEILVPVANPATAPSLLKMAAALAGGNPEPRVVALSVVPVPLSVPLQGARDYLDTIETDKRQLLRDVARWGQETGVPLRPLLRPAYNVASGICEIAKNRSETRMILLGWRGPFSLRRIRTSIDKEVIRSAAVDTAVFLDRHTAQLRRILVPVGGGPHARLGLRLAHELAESQGAEVVVMRIVLRPETLDMAAEEAALNSIIRNEWGKTGNGVSACVVPSHSVVAGIVDEAARGYDLLIIGASEEWFLRNWLFGSIPDVVAEQASCSVLLVRKHEPASVSRLRRISKKVQA
ncbi:MAG: amino acid permease, partial [Anaerolineae bacterium]